MPRHKINGPYSGYETGQNRKPRERDFQGCIVLCMWGCLFSGGLFGDAVTTHPPQTKDNEWRIIKMLEVTETVLRTEMTIHGLKMKVEFFYTPPEKATRDYPGVDAEVEILGIQVAGDEIDFCWLFAKDALVLIEKWCFEAIDKDAEDYKNRQAQDEYDHDSSYRDITGPVCL